MYLQHKSTKTYQQISWDNVSPVILPPEANTEILATTGGLHRVVQENLGSRTISKVTSSSFRSWSESLDDTLTSFDIIQVTGPLFLPVPQQVWDFTLSVQVFSYPICVGSPVFFLISTAGCWGFKSYPSKVPQSRRHSFLPL